MSFSLKRFFVGAIFSLLLASSVLAASDPVHMLQSVTDQVTSELKANRALLDAQPDRINDIVDRFLMPHVDFQEMSRWVAGRAAWNNASEKERQAFIKVFRELVIRTYAGSLNDYENQTIEYMPLRGAAEGAQVQVFSVISSPDAAPVHLAYRLTRASGEWKVYDIVIEGVSLLKGFQNQFSTDIAHDGLPAVTEKIRAHNAQ